VSAVWRATLKSLLGRKLRLILTALSVVLGVGFVAGTFVLTDTMNRAFDDLFATASEGSDVVVRSAAAFDPTQVGPAGGGSEGREAIPQELLEQVEGVQGVASVSGDVSGYAQMVDPATGDAIGGAGPPTIGGNWTDTNPSLVLREGMPPSAPGEVVVDAATASSYSLSVDTTIRILFQGPPREFRIVGIAGFGDADNLAGATLALFETVTAQEVLDKEGEFDSISIVADAGVAATELRAGIQRALPEGVEAVTSSTVADEQSEALQEGLGFFRIALLVFALIALFVGAFIIFNTFSIIVAQRTKELALLRALGASRGQVTASVIAEAAVVGLLSSLIGILVGVGIALGLRGLLGAFNVDLPTTTLQVLPRTIVVSVLLGIGVTVLSSILPARRAARVAPIQAMRETEAAAPGAGLGRRFTIGAVVTGLGAAGLLYGLFGTPANAAALVGAGAAAAFVGVAMLSPLVARPVARWLGAPATGQVQGRLGRENAMRNPRRTASTASALMIGLGLVSMVAILSASLKASFDAALTETLKADFTLTTTSFTTFSPDVAERVRQLPQVAAVTEFRQGGFRVEGGTSFITAVDPSTIDETATLKVSSGGVESLNHGEVLVFTDAADERNLRVGDTLPAEFATVGKAPLTVGGTFEENRLVGGDYVVSLETFDTYFTEQLDTFVLVKGAEGVPTAEVRSAVEDAAAGFASVEVQDQAAFREQQAGFIDQLLGLVTALLFMSILIALFGIVNTLGLSIYERTRELGLLRAVGMSRTQVKRMIRWESVIIAIFGAVLGLVVGALFGWALQQALQPEGVTELAIPVGQLALYLLFAALAGVLAAIWPARRAAKLNVLEAMAYE
jgi:putative ABC transport system permease protein